jgi:hypothetical protein
VSKRLLENRRLGFPVDAYGRPRTDARDGEWTDSIRREARWGYLAVLAKECPPVLTTLREVREDDRLALRSWAVRSGLVSADPDDNWTIAHAQATIRQCATYRVTCWFDRDDITGVFVPDDGPAESRPLRHGEHFVWLARFQTGAGWKHITPNADTKTVRDAVTSLAMQLRLQLRPTHRGRPKK